MRSHIVTDEFVPNSPEAQYLCDVTAHLAGVLPGLHLTPDLGLALRAVIMTLTITFRDSFIIQDLRSLATIIGHVEASLIVAALDHDPRHSADWWNQQRFVHQEVQAGERHYHELIAQITAHPDVLSAA